MTHLRQIMLEELERRTEVPLHPIPIATEAERQQQVRSSIFPVGGNCVRKLASRRAGCAESGLISHIADLVIGESRWSYGDGSS